MPLRDTDPPSDPGLLLRLLDSDETAAARRYTTIRAKLVFFFGRHGVRDAEDLADEVFARVVRRVSEGATLDAGISAYCYGVADFVLKESRRVRQASELPADLPGKDDPPPGGLSRTEKAIEVRQLLSGLPPADRELFSRYHLEDREDLAKAENTTANALRIRVFRIRQKIIDGLEKARRHAANERREII